MRETRNLRLLRLSGRVGLLGLLTPGGSPVISGHHQDGSDKVASAGGHCRLPGHGRRRGSWLVLVRRRLGRCGCPDRGWDDHYVTLKDGPATSEADVTEVTRSLIMVR